MIKSALLLGAALVAVPALAQPTPAASPAASKPASKIKNVIVVVNDGGGPTVYDATRLYLGHDLVTDGKPFRRTFASTFPLRPDSPTNNTPGSDEQDPSSVYDSAKFWDITPIAGPSTVSGYSAYPAAFAGYEFSRFAHPDSGNTASALSNGHKTYNNAINVDGSGDPEITIVDLLEAARKGGKRTGVVTTVEFADATPAALGGAHNIARANRNAIADEMFGKGNLDVIAGAGSPDYDDNGVLRATPLYTWVSQATWTDLVNGTNVSGNNAYNFNLVRDRDAIQALANGTAPAPEKLAMIVKSYTSTQFNRAGETTNPADPHTKEPFTDPLRTDVPTQAELTVAALNALGRQITAKGNARGFYLMTEAGAVDRAEHANNEGRMIEEQIASNDTVQAIIDWVNRADTDANWDNTLLIVTADHDHLLYGPDGATVPFQKLQDKGAGTMPAAKFFGPNHGTGLVPLYAYGAGSKELIAAATHVDTYLAPNGKRYGHGNYLDQTEVGNFLKSVLAK